MKLSHFLSKIPRQFFKYFAPLFPLREKVIFDNFGGRGFGDCPKYIATSLHKQSPKTKILWIIDKRTTKTIDLPSYIKPLFVDSALFYYHLGTAKVWVSNFRDPFFQMRKKRSGQYYLQTWHGSGPGKKIEKDAEQYLSPDYIKSAKRDSKITDLIIASSDLNRRIFEQSYWYNGPVFCCESPRNDGLFDSRVREKTRKKLNIKDKKLCLYAPTFRKNENTDVYDIDYLALKKALESRFGGEWVISIRLHPNLAAKADQLNIPVFVENLTLYPDMQELLSATDLLITDFSSCMHDFCLTKRPVILYAPDYDDYLKNERDTYLDPKTFPFPLAKTNKELTTLINGFDDKKYLKELRAFSKIAGLYPGAEGSKKVAGIICDWLKDKSST